MKNYQITAKKLKEHQQKAHLERSLAFQKSLIATGRSVKYLFSRPEALIPQAANKKRRISKLKSGAVTV